MEETISMNIKKTYIPLLLCAVLSAVGLSACSSDDDVDLPTEGRTGLRFSVQGVQTRLDYDFASTYFDNDETIGCVIAEVNGGSTTFLCNTKWTYSKSDGMLILSDNNDYVTKGQDDPSLLELKSDKTLKFCFYYPYVDRELLEAEYDRIISSTATDKYKLLVYPNCANSGTIFPEVLPNEYYDNFWSQIMLTGTAAKEKSSSTVPYINYLWTEYPCFVNHTQGDPSAQGVLNDKRLQNSDFLWAASPEIDENTQHTVNLTFKKKTATILVYSENRLADIYFTPNGGQTLKRGKRINLSTGELSDYEYSTASDVSAQQKNMYFNAGEHIVPCYRGQDTAENQQYDFYRIVLPAQENCRFTMYIKGDFDRDGSTPDEWKAINLSDDDGLTELKEGYLYTIRISKDGRTKILINDWQPDGWFEIEEVTD